MTERLVRVKRGTYMDSVRVMGATRKMLDVSGVVWAGAMMGTPAEVKELGRRGFSWEELEGTNANDLILAVEARDGFAGEAAFAVAEELLAANDRPDENIRLGSTAHRHPRTLRDALAELSDSNLALISVPGPYAALEAHRALSAGLHVLLFSDNVPAEDEVELKIRAAHLGLLLMGPGAGTALVGGVGLGFCNIVTKGGVGIAAAAGTGAQELMCLVSRWGAGVSHVLGLGGRDLSATVGGRMAALAVDALEADEATEAVVLVSKPPAPAVARSLLARTRRKPIVTTFLGLEPVLNPAGPSISAGIQTCGTLESAAAAAVRLCGLPRPRPETGMAALGASTMASLHPGRRTVRGLFSGGTLCHEAMLLLCERLGPVHSNVPLRSDWGLPAPVDAHVCLDLGDEEFTRGRPHPMIDPESRVDLLMDAARDPSAAVILLDVVLGFGSHPDPAGVLAPVCREIAQMTDGPVLVTYVLGTDQDPQRYTAQCKRLKDAGCLVAPTAARAALLAGAIAARRPTMAEEEAA